MLDRIKCSFFQKTLLNHLDEKRKLEIVKYNKSLQKQIGVKLINYKLFKGIYIIYETKEKAREYDFDNDLIYEGEYLNGKRHGKGKEYYCNGSLLYEGEYLNGKKHGKGKEYLPETPIPLSEFKYFKNGKENNLIFEGEYLNGKKWNGDGYDFNGDKIYELKDGKGFILEFDALYRSRLKFAGEYLNGEKNGKGKEFSYYWDPKAISIFEGEFLNDKKWKGIKKSYFYNLEIHTEYLNGKKWNVTEYDKNKNIISTVIEGNGHFEDLYYEGEYLNGERNGKGKLYDFTGDLEYEGEFLNGEKNGKGKFFDCMGEVEYEGEYLNGYRHGKGKNYFPEGQLRFEGEYLYGSKIKGKEYINGKLEYEGEYLFNKKWDGKGYDEKGNVIYELKNGNGYAKEFNQDGYLDFEGEYINGFRNGKGKEYIFQGILEFEGEYLNGFRNGKGKEYDKSGNLIYEGDYSFGKRKESK